MTLQFRQRLLSSTLLIGVTALATPAYAAAQPAPPPTPPTDSSPTNVQANPSGPVEAQPIPSSNAQGAPVTSGGDIVVTGTRIPQPNLTSAAPVQVVTNQDIKLTGTTRIEDVLNQLPSAAASQSSGVSNGATGTAEIDLRYLGAKRTLSLVNGRRLTPGDPNSTSQAADLNLIPASLIKRIEVLTGGASSVYGADAVAGVVNFIIDTTFTGVKFDGQYSFNQHGNNCPVTTQGRTVCQANDLRTAAGLPNYGYPRGSVVDGGTFDGTVSIGAAFDDNRGHAVAYFGYRKVNAILQSRRDYSNCGLQGTAAVTCGGSLISAEGNVFLFDPNVSTKGSTAYTFGPNRTIANGTTRFNFNPYNYFQRPDERYIGGAFADYEVSPAIKPYLEFMFMDDHTLAQIAPSGDFGNTFTINCDNPLMSTQANGIICAPANTINGFLGTFPLATAAPFNTGAPGSGTTGPLAPPLVFTDAGGNAYNIAYFNLLRRNVEGGPRISDLKHQNWRGVIGSRGDISKVWSYDGYFQYGRTEYTQVYRNEFSLRRLTNALNVVNIDPVTRLRVPVGTAGSTTVCRSVLDNTDPSCVPYDVFGTPSAAAVNYLNVFGVIDGQTSEQVADLNFTGALGEMGVQTPWSDEGVGVNFGTEYRKEALTLNPDQEFQTGDLTGQGAPTLPVNGNFRVLEAFAEVQIPIIRHSFFEELSIGAGYRKSYYKLSTGRTYDTDTYKVSAEFAPISDIRFRGSYNRAVRAPNIQELFAPQFVGLDGSSDPCSATELGHAVTATDYGCIAQGLAVGQSTPSNPAAQYNGLLGGNPNLNPEKATTKTVGVVLQPRFLPRFALTVDYWNIEVAGAIQGFGADTILADCIDRTTATTVAPSCAFIHRNPAGSLWLSSGGFVVDTPTNVGGIKTDGIDVSSSYSHRLGGLGNLSASFQGTWLRKYVTDNGLADPYNCAGFYGGVCSGGTVASSSPMPKWRHKARLSLQMPNGIGLSLQWRYIGAVAHEHNSSDNALAGHVPQLGGHIPAFNYFDLASTFAIGDHYNFRLGMNNILDKVPPLVGSSDSSCAAGSCNGNTYPGTWDSLGRYIYAGVTLNF
jgi:iron complex outermembrane receptor protein